MIAWQDVENSSEYNTLSDSDKIKAKVFYYKDFVEPLAIDDNMPLDKVKKDFFEAVKFKPEISPSKEIIKGVGKTAIGLGETALSGASGLVAQIPAGLGAVGAMLRGQSPEKAFEEIATPLTYKSITKEGESGVSALSYPFELINELADKYGDEVLDRWMKGGVIAQKLAPILGASTNAVIRLLPFGLMKRQEMGKTITGKILPDEMITKEPPSTSPEVSDIATYKRKGIEPKGYVYEPEIVEPEIRQLSPAPERKLLKEPDTKRLPPSPITYGDNFVAMNEAIAPEIKRPYAGQRRLSEATDFEVTPEGQGINIKGQELLSREGNKPIILYDNLNKQQAVYQREKTFKQTGVKPEIRQMADGSYYLYVTKPEFKAEVLGRSQEPPQTSEPPSTPPSPQIVFDKGGIRITPDNRVYVTDFQNKELEVGKFNNFDEAYNKGKEAQREIALGVAKERESNIVQGKGEGMEIPKPVEGIEGKPKEAGLREVDYNLIPENKIIKTKFSEDFYKGKEVERDIKTKDAIKNISDRYDRFSRFLDCLNS